MNTIILFNKPGKRRPILIAMKLSALFLLFIPSLLITSPGIVSAEISAKDIVQRSDDLLRGDTHRGTYTMTVTTPAWQRELKLNVASKGRDEIFIRILAPAKEAGIGTLRIKNEMWNYLPSVEKTIKIPPSMMMQAWMGSDFDNDDLVKESSIVNDYTHTVIDGNIISDGHPVAKVLLLPRPGAAVIWGSILRWVRTDDFVPLREEYYDEHGKLIKTLEFSDITKVSDRIIPATWKMTSSIQPGHTTTIKLIDVEYNIPIDDSIFTMTNLQKIQ
jgi:outer membrane lipoprotein-sorting protein